MRIKRFFWILLLAGTILAGCATLPPVEHGWRPLINGTGHYYLNKKYYPARDGGAYVYSSRFYFGSSGFFRSESFTIRKVVAPTESYYVLAIGLNRMHYSPVYSIVIKVDGSTFRLTDNNPWMDFLPVGFVRFDEQLRFRLDPALVAKLENAGAIGIQDLAGPINLTFRERAVLQSFLLDTAGPGPF